MTFGRPSMTSNIPSIPLPTLGCESLLDDPCKSSGQPCDHRLGYLTFYVSAIELYGILESILSDIYNAWQSRSGTNSLEPSRSIRDGSLDVIMDLDDKLSAYEANVPGVLNWTKKRSSHRANRDQTSILERQRNILQARYDVPPPISLCMLIMAQVYASSTPALPSHVYTVMFRRTEWYSAPFWYRVTQQKQRPQNWEKCCILDCLGELRGRLHCCGCRSYLLSTQDLSDDGHRCVVV